MKQLAFMFEARLVPKLAWVLGEQGLPLAAESAITLLAAGLPAVDDVAVLTFGAIVKQAMGLPPDLDAIPEDLTAVFTDARNALRDNRGDLKDLLQEQGWDLVMCDNKGRPALGKSGGKVEGFALLASPTGDVHTGQQVTMALANAVSAVHARRVAGLLDGIHEQKALGVVDELRLLLMPPETVPTE